MVVVAKVLIKRYRNMRLQKKFIKKTDLYFYIKRKLKNGGSSQINDKVR